MNLRFVKFQNVTSLSVPLPRLSRASSCPCRGLTVLAAAPDWMRPDFVLPGANQAGFVPGSTREHNPAGFVLPEAHPSRICAPGSTTKQDLCSRKHN